MADIHTLSDRMLVKVVANHAITASTTAETVIDCLGYTRACMILTSTPSGSGTTLNATLTEGALANGSDQSAVTTGFNFTTASFTQTSTVTGNQVQMMNIDLSYRLRYLSLSTVGAGGSAAGTVTAVIVLFNGEGQPPTQQLTAVTL